MNTNEWQPIETAPKDGTKILVFCCDKDDLSDQFITLIHWCDALNSWNDYGYNPYGFLYNTNITHWMPLPQPPQK